MIESYDPQTRAWAEREQADEERRRLERTEREGAPGPSCPDCGLPMARVAGPDGHGWTCVNCNAAGDPEGNHPEPLRPLHIRDFPASEYLFPRPSDPDADRPCSCEESLQLKAAVLELQNQLAAVTAEKERWRIDRDAQSLAKSMAVQRADGLVAMNRECIKDRDSARVRLEKAVAILELWNNYHESEGIDPTPHEQTAAFLKAEEQLYGSNALRVKLDDAEQRIHALEQRAIAAESRANALRLKLEEGEARVRVAERANLEMRRHLDQSRERVRELEQQLALVTEGREFYFHKNEAAESEARALRERIARALAIFEDATKRGVWPSFDKALGVLRGS